MPTLAPTDEQQAVIDGTVSGDNLVIQAGAGTGKTSTLEMASQEIAGKSVLYVAFNKTTADDASKRFPAHVHARTAHSLAFRAVGVRYKERLGGARQPSYIAADKLKLSKNLFNLGGDIEIKRNPMASITLQTVRNFCYSADTEITEAHVPHQTGLNFLQHQQLAQHVAPIARRAWEDIKSPNGQLKFEHDHYLKIWALGRPELGVDVVMLDEGQDCQPEGTKVLTPTGVEAIENLRPGDRVISYTPSGCRLRMRGSAITSVSSRDVDEDVVAIGTENGLSTRYTEGHICLAKIGPAVVGKTILYLMRRGTAWRVGITSAYHGKRQKVSGLAGRIREEDGDAIWILDVFDTKLDALAAEARVPAKFGIPEMRFVDNGHRSFGQDRLDDFWADMGDLTESAFRLLAAYGRRVEYPLLTRSALGKGYLLYTRAATVRACNLLPGMEVLDANQLLDRRSQLQRRFDDPAWSSISVKRERYTGKIWSLDVEGDHTYVGDGIVTHNCNPVLVDLIKGQYNSQQIVVGDTYQSMYQWRGSVDALGSWENAETLYLSQSWRFGQVIADEANKWLGVLGAQIRLTGNPGQASILADLPSPDAILCRTNAGAMQSVLNQMGDGKKVALVGGGQPLIYLVEGLAALQSGKTTSHPELFVFKDWTQLLTYVNEDGGDLKPVVDMLENYGAPTLLGALNALSLESQAEVVVSTAHKAKGREWPTVRIGPDFMAPKNPDAGPEDLSSAEAMISYVAVTRARQELDRGGLAWIDKFVGVGA